jgi:hypothetical protein
MDWELQQKRPDSWARNTESKQAEGVIVENKNVHGLTSQTISGTVSFHLGF